MKFLISRQLLALLAIGATVGGVEMARRSSNPTGTAAAPSNARRTPARAANQGTSAVADVKLELLKAAPSELEPSTRNPFQFKPKAPPPAPRPQAVVRPPIVIAPPVPQGPPPPPPIALKYIGVLDTAQGRVAVFRDSGGDIVNGKEGDIIDGRYRLLKIGVESADLAYLDGRGRQTIRLGGQ
jgi:hypothetical protein